MRITILALGSRGDVQPFVALALTLQQRGHTVRIAAPEDYAFLVEDYGLPFHVLGGLIRENATNNESGVPFLHTLPVIGNLFGTTTKEDRRTELLVIITPRALYNEQDLRDVSEEMRRQIRHMELIEIPPE